MIASYMRGRRECSAPAARKVTPRRRDIRQEYAPLGVARNEETNVAVFVSAREVLRAPALRVEVGELARDAREALAVVVDHPGLQGDPVPGLPEAEHAGLLCEVGEGGGADQPEASMPADAALVRVAGDGGDDVGVAVEDRQRLGSELVVAEDDDPAIRVELALEALELLRRDARLARALRIHGVDQDGAEVRAELDRGRVRERRGHERAPRVGGNVNRG